MNRRFLSIWFPIIATGTVILLVVYGVVSQVYRQMAYDPQIELVENAREALDLGQSIDLFFTNTPKVDMSNSLSMFAMIFDDAGNPLASTAYNATSSPLLPPSGVFAYVREHGQDRVTWQPRPGLRFAVVIDRYQNQTSSGFVMAARSLSEVERRTDNLGWMVFCGWLILILVSAGASYLSLLLVRLSNQ